MSYDPEQTSAAIGRISGNSLDPLNMLNDGQKESFKIIGVVRSDLNELKEALAAKDATQDADIKSHKEDILLLREALKTLQNRLWALLAGVILAVVGGGITCIVNLL